MEQQGKTENNGNSRLETGNIWKLMLSLSIPSIIAQLVGILYNMVDRMFIGRIENGTTAMAALSVSLPLITCITAFTRLVGIGGAPLCAIKMGKKDQRGAEEILGVSFAALITVGVILTVVILVFQRPILTLFGADPTTLDMACDYVSIYALGTVFVMISLGMNSYITTQGFARTGMCTVLIGAILNIIFDAFFINYLHMGVKGAAIATIIAQGISCTCRACGHVLKCPHCDVSLSQHVTRQHPEGKMVCHYCGYEIPMPKTCPACGSRYISGFKAGTQKIEMIVKERFPQARVLRMDMDTTRNKEGYEQILSAFANQEADILIGTQMIVKGHDFPNVTLVGVLAADLSLYVSDYHAAERTFQLLTQAAGRAGRGSEPGEVVIQTYRPDHYSVQTAKEQDYEAFYEQEMEYRRMLLYPPVWNMLVILCASKQEQTAYDSAKLLVQEIDTWQENIKAAMERVGEDFKKKRVFPVGPADPAVAKVNDIYKKVIYIKTKDYQTLVELKDRLEHYMRDNKAFKDTVVQFDFNPMSGF